MSWKAMTDDGLTSSMRVLMGQLNACIKEAGARGMEVTVESDPAHYNDCNSEQYHLVLKMVLQAEHRELALMAGRG